MSHNARADIFVGSETLQKCIIEVETDVNNCADVQWSERRKYDAVRVLDARLRNEDICVGIAAEAFSREKEVSARQANQLHLKVVNTPNEQRQRPTSKAPRASFSGTAAPPYPRSSTGILWKDATARAQGAASLDVCAIRITEAVNKLSLDKECGSDMSRINMKR